MSWLRKRLIILMFLGFALINVYVSHKGVSKHHNIHQPLVHYTRFSELNKKIENATLSTSSSLNRRIISVYDHLNSSIDFTSIAYPSPPKTIVRFAPKVSERDCNRPELLKKRIGGNKIIWGHLKTIIPAKQQQEHCLSALTKNPTRYEITEQPLFVAATHNDAYINENGVVQTENEILVWARSCFGTVKRHYNQTSCSSQVDSLFVASHWWSNETGHFLHETLPRIVPYLDLAQQMPVHIRGETITTQIKGWFDYLNLTAIYGTICAKRVYIASPADCRGGAFMSNMHLKMQQFFLDSPLITGDNKQQLKDTHKLVLILHRDDSRTSDREPIRDIEDLVTKLENAAYENIKVLKSSDVNLWSCVPCQLKIFRQTWLFISSHGAGLFNFVFMPPGAYVVEIASKARPEEPLYSSAGQTTYALGQHYYHYYWQETDLDSKMLDVDFFVKELLDFAPPHQH